VFAPKVGQFWHFRSKAGDFNRVRRFQNRVILRISQTYSQSELVELLKDYEPRIKKHTESVKRREGLIAIRHISPDLKFLES